MKISYAEGPNNASGAVTVLIDKDCSVTFGLPMKGMEPLSEDSELPANVVLAVVISTLINSQDKVLTGLIQSQLENKEVLGILNAVASAMNSVANKNRSGNSGPSPTSPTSPTLAGGNTTIH